MSARTGQQIMRQPKAINHAFILELLGLQFMQILGLHIFDNLQKQLQIWRVGDLPAYYQWAIQKEPVQELQQLWQTQFLQRKCSWKDFVPGSCTNQVTYISCKSIRIKGLTSSHDSSVFHGGVAVTAECWMWMRKVEFSPFSPIKILRTKKIEYHFQFPK